MKDILEKVVADLNIGSTIKYFEPLSGGALHKMWKVETDHGQFALKEINPHITEKPSFLPAYEASEKISELFHQKGVPAVSALNINNHYIHNISNQWFIVYPFVMGEIVSIDELNTAQLKIIGNIFSQMHRLELQVEGVDTPHYDFFSDEHWTHLINLAQLAELTTLLPQILSWNNKYNSSIEFLNKSLVITHRDLHHLNVLWDKQSQPHVIDWETSGLMNPLLEVIGYSIEWGGIISGSFEPDNTKIILEGYKSKTNVAISQNDIAQAFYGWIGHCVMGWTEFNLRRMMGKTSSNPKEIKIGKDIINRNMIKCISYLSNNENKMLDMLFSILN